MKSSWMATLQNGATDKTLRVASVGLCCSVGYTAKAASCAMRAGMDHFQEGEFVTSNGEAIRVARLPDNETWGTARLVCWMAHAIDDCLSQGVVLQDTRLLTIVLTAENDRCAIDLSHLQQLTLSSIPSAQLHSNSEIVRTGRAGLAPVLDKAHELLSEGVCKQVLVLGIDSFLNAETVNHYLRADRLLVPGNRDGFIPGEAAAAVLLELAPPDVPGLHIVGWGRGEEPGRPDGSVPSRAQGLSRALRTAFDQADIDCNDLAFRMSDQNGEGFFAGEAANAFTRVAVDGGTTPMVYTTADCAGEVGAATGALMLAWLQHLLPRPDGPGDCGVIHLANDDGLRSAVVVRHQQAPCDRSIPAL